MSGAEGRGAGVLACPNGAPKEPPFPGPWHVEAQLANDGFDRKLYVAGERVFGLLKAWPREENASPMPFEPPEKMVDLALRVGRAVDLEIYGVDLVGRDGVFGIVDVNPFPGFRGIPEAGQAIADHIAARLSEAG
ncbi:ATP-grasp domain-containing protein [Aestuariibius sp. 2305UL40-4]|uniref:ATP-grasp domain-containing protein n=1 Tax=Aestuariibius violaceus TaxID=3234132 RepID=UPI00345E27B1